MIYFLIVPILLIYFELFGQAIFNFLKKETYSFSFGIGIIAWLAFAYVFTSVLTAMRCSFYLIFFIYGLFLLFSIFFVAKNVKKINFSFIKWFLIILIATLMLYYSFNQKLGDLDGLDSTHYLNMVTGNMGLKSLNTRSVVYGTYGFSISYQYSFQSFYYLISCLLFALEKICGAIKIIFYSPAAYIWIFQYLYNFFFLSLLFNACEYFFKKNKAITIVLIAFFVLCYYRTYFNSVYGFYGNTYRTVVFSYVSLFLYERIKNDNKANFSLYVMGLFATCATSSTSVFMLYFMLFALFFVWFEEKENIFKEFAIVLFVPTIDLLSVLKGNILLGIFISVIFCSFLYFANDKLISLIKHYKLKWALLFISVVTMIVLSYKATGIFYNIDALVFSGSEQFDMTFNYLYDIVSYKAIKNYKMVAIFFLILSLLFKFKEKIVQMYLILFLVIFNPFCCGILSEINDVWYRSFELIVNPCTIIMMMSLCLTLINIKCLYYVEIAIIIVATVTSEKPSDVQYWHSSFMPADGYNYLYKMTNDEFDVIQELKENIQYYKIDEPKIITTNILTQSYIPNGEYIYGREKAINKNWKKSELELYKIFYPVLYWNDPAQPKNPDYDHMCEYIKDAEIDFIVQDKKVEYYDEEQNIWYPLSYKIDGCGNYAFYENDSYLIYSFFE